MITNPNTFTILIYFIATFEENERTCTQIIHDMERITKHALSHLLPYFTVESKF